MASRIGKYKISKRESTLSLADGGTIAGNLTVTGTATVTGATALNGNVDIGNAVSDTVGFFGKTKVARTALIYSGSNHGNAVSGQLTGSSAHNLISILSQVGIISSSIA